MIKIKPLKLEQNLHLLAKHNDDVDVVWIYGSMVDGTATETSDVDIAIAFCHFPDDPLEQLARPDILASAWMKKLNQFNRKLSIVDINKIPIPLAWEFLLKQSLRKKVMQSHHRQLRYLLFFRFAF